MSQGDPQKQKLRKNEPQKTHTWVKKCLDQNKAKTSIDNGNTRNVSPLITSTPPAPQRLGGGHTRSRFKEKTA